MNKLVSIVIPIFNEETNLIECIDSVLEQDYENLEIIFVDDGSWDNSVNICKKYCAKYPHMFIHIQVHKGPGAARNLGMSYAKGEYIIFLDADDCFDGNNAISKLVSCAEANNADIVCGSFRKLTEDGISEVYYHYLDEINDHNSVEFRFRGFFQYGHLGFNWGKLYRKEFIIRNQLTIPLYPYIEDKAFNIRCCICQPKFAFVKESIYIYRISNKVVDFQDKSDFPIVWTRVALEAEEFTQAKSDKRDCEDILAFHLFLGLYSLGKQKLNTSDISILKLRDVLKQYCDFDIVNRYFKCLSKGRYIKSIKSKGWRLVIRSVSFLCTIKWYYVLALSMFLMNMLRIDKKVISGKYQKKE